MLDLVIVLPIGLPSHEAEGEAVLQIKKFVQGLQVSCL